MPRLIKTYINVDVRFTPEGDMEPLSLRWKDEQVYEVDRILDVGRHASNVGGNPGMIRYICRIGGKERILYYEPGYGGYLAETAKSRWFVEERI